LFQGGCRFDVQIELGPQVFRILSHGSKKIAPPATLCLYGFRPNSKMELDAWRTGRLRHGPAPGQGNVGPGTSGNAGPNSAGK
jgi:hypothetical protein